MVLAGRGSALRVVGGGGVSKATGSAGVANTSRFIKLFQMVTRIDTLSKVFIVLVLLLPC